MENSWTPEEDETLRKMWGPKSSAEEIGQLIKKSRNAVIGRARRLKLVYHKPRMFSTSKEKSVPARRALDLPVVPSDEGKGFLELEGKYCAWPLWEHNERPNQRFCGKKTISKSSYCAECHATAYTKAPKPNRRRLADERLH